ncbi:TcaA NTF2-like domain-containing protein [Rossellomorea sp. LjRoot5]|uniref:TcaA NTF2-like domain-containing protein n=1 Tax=Rossellomorea sp. LjRoot5 TaxID=3342331 RepID=UPI003ECC5872
MSYCTECGESLKNDLAFCESCGAKREVDKEESIKKVPKTTLSKKKKVSLFIAGMLVVGLVSTHMILSSIYDPMKKIQSMDNAMTSNSEEGFLEYIAFDKDSLLNKKQYFSYIKALDWEDMREQLVSITESDLTFDAFVKDQRGHDVFKVERDSILGFYETYDIEAVPNRVFITTNMEPATFKIGDKTVSVKDSSEPVEVGKAYSGTYTVKADAANLYGEFSIEDDIEVKSTKSGDSKYNLEFNGDTYAIDTNFPEAVLFINGESTKKSLQELEYLGPFPEDKEVTMFAELSQANGESLKSEEVTQQQGSWGSLSFVFAEEEENLSADSSTSMEEANQFVLDFRDSYEQALNTRDYTLISSYLLSGSLAEKELVEYIGDLQDKDYSYDFRDNTILNSKEAEEGIFEITTNENFIFTNHLGEQTTYDREKIYTIIKEDSAFKIKKIDIHDTERNEI